MITFIYLMVTVAGIGYGIFELLRGEILVGIGCLVAGAWFAYRGSSRVRRMRNDEVFAALDESTLMHRLSPEDIDEILQSTRKRDGETALPG